MIEIAPNHSLQESSKCKSFAEKTANARTIETSVYLVFKQNFYYQINIDGIDLGGSLLSQRLTARELDSVGSSTHTEWMYIRLLPSRGQSQRWANAFARRAASTLACRQ